MSKEYPKCPCNNAAARWEPGSIYCGTHQQGDFTCSICGKTAIYLYTGGSSFFAMPILGPVGRKFMKAELNWFNTILFPSMLASADNRERDRNGRLLGFGGDYLFTDPPTTMAMFCIDENNQWIRLGQ